MYLTMNRFKVRLGQEEAFEEVWRTRDSHLDSVPGFKAFSLLRGPSNEDHTLYASHTMWEDEAAFVAWTKSQAFRDAHKGVKPNTDMYEAAPVLETFASV